MQGRFLFLGSGGSMGVPVIGCSCPVCTSNSPNNKRLRSSGLLKVQGKAFLIDAGPDFREQALKYRINHLDGILLTHTHFDHIGGLDDLRVFYFIQRHPLSCLVSQETFEELKVRYHYLMIPLQNGKTVCTQLDFQILEGDFGKVDFQGVPIHYLTYFQAGMKVTGYRIGNFAYVSDIREYTDEVIEALKGVETLVLSALRFSASEMHFSVEEAIAFARKVRAKKTWFTHIAHDLDHDKTNELLPPDIRMGYDGLEITF